MTNANNKVHLLHLSIAEAGKVKALAGDHQAALACYREAIRLAVSSDSAEVFFRHYTQCVLESLELTGSFEEVVDYCEKANEHYQNLNLKSGLHRADHAAIIERLGIVLLKQGDDAAAGDQLRVARELAGAGGLPLTDEVLRWLQRGYAVDARRLLAEQQRHGYFVVRDDQVDHELAKRAPANLPGVQADAALG